MHGKIKGTQTRIKIKNIVVGTEMIIDLVGGLDVAY